nr:immunoglobulin light chain junction region [Macaca mulatta]MOW58024.1 immunoglobulin light chain junction region [Macaca mulatta]MOW58618.1 immunoglobulin light chain junction region [Macaca mulatta]MOW61407.1 immunoglobulin light chain junction region [Macaca mulatta]
DYYCALYMGSGIWLF